MNRKHAEDWLRKAIDFAEAPTEKKFDMMVTNAEALSISYHPDLRTARDHGINYLEKASTDLKRVIEEIMQEWGSDVSPAHIGFIYTADAGGGNDGVITCIEDDSEKNNYSGFSVILMMVMQALGVKFIVRCGFRECNKLIFATRTDKRYCDNNCRQKEFQHSLPETEKKALNKARVERRRKAQAKVKKK